MKFCAKLLSATAQLKPQYCVPACVDGSGGEARDLGEENLHLNPQVWILIFCFLSDFTHILDLFGSNADVLNRFKCLRHIKSSNQLY